MRRLALVGASLLLAAAPAQARVAHARHHASAVRHGLRTAAHRAARPSVDPYGWGTTVYGASLPFVNGTCVDPYDPDPIGGPDRVGEGGPGGYGPQCRGQAGVIPGTTVR